MKSISIALLLLASTAVYAQETFKISKPECWALQDTLKDKSTVKSYYDTRIFTTQDVVYAITCSRGLVHRYSSTEYRQLEQKLVDSAEARRTQDQAELQKVIDRIVTQ
jgi:hypothetical protein